METLKIERGGISLNDMMREARDKVVPVDFGEEEFGRPGGAGAGAAQARLRGGGSSADERLTRQAPPTRGANETAPRDCLHT
jgi:hypothetical protein